MASYACFPVAVVFLRETDYDGTQVEKERKDRNESYI